MICVVSDVLISPAAISDFAIAGVIVRNVPLRVTSLLSICLPSIVFLGILSISSNISTNSILSLKLTPPLVAAKIAELSTMGDAGLNSLRMMPALS